MTANKAKKSNLQKSRGGDNHNDKIRKSSSPNISILKIWILLSVAIVATASYNTWNLLRLSISSVSIIDHDDNPNNDDDKVDDQDILYNAAIRRLCHCMVIGTQKGGTRALSTFLRYSHPNVSKDMGRRLPELHFFDQEWELLNFTTNTSSTTTSFPLPLLLRKEHDQVTAQQQQQQEQFLQHAFNRVNKKRKFVRNPHVIGMHASPEYLFLSDRVPSRVLSTCPGTKLITLLREPVSRAVSQYNHMYHYWNASQKSYPNNSPDEYIHHDIAQLKAAGVVQDWTRVDFDSFSGSTAEVEAWTRYIDKVGGNGPVGRGLYAIQLRHWYSEFDKYGKPHSDMLILESSETIANTPKQYAKMLDFLNLPAQTILQEDAVKHETRNKFKATEDTIAMLKSFFKPYNEQLYNLVDGWDAKRW